SLNRAKRSADTGRTCANDHYIVNIARSFLLGEIRKSLGDSIHTVAALVYGILDQRQSRQFPYDETVPNTGLMLQRQDWHVGAHAGTCHHHCDGADRACLRAKTVAYALVAVHDRGFAAEHGKNIAFRTHASAAAAADAVVRINMWMLRAWTL